MVQSSECSATLDMIVFLSKQDFTAKYCFQPPLPRTCGPVAVSLTGCQYLPLHFPTLRLPPMLALSSPAHPRHGPYSPLASASPHPHCLHASLAGLPLPLREDEGVRLHSCFAFVPALLHRSLIPAVLSRKAWYPGFNLQFCDSTDLFNSTPLSLLMSPSRQPKSLMGRQGFK